MKQPIKKVTKKANKVRKKERLHKSNGKLVRTKPKFGTSKLEQDFAHDFLDKLGIEYIWQFEAKDIERFYDYYLPKSNLIIEVDGDYWHSNPEKVDENNLNRVQKHNKWVDKVKDEWALLHGIPILRIWENDIRNNPQKVMKILKDRLYIETDKQKLIENKNKRHKNKLL